MTIVDQHTRFLLTCYDLQVFTGRDRLISEKSHQLIRARIATGKRRPRSHAPCPKTSRLSTRPCQPRRPAQLPISTIGKTLRTETSTHRISRHFTVQRVTHQGTIRFKHKLVFLFRRHRCPGGWTRPNWQAAEQLSRRLCRCQAPCCHLQSRRIVQV